MGRDLTGQQFGRLLVLDRAGTSDRGEILWRCQCDCGTEHVAKGWLLRKGDTKSCGCLRRAAKRCSSCGRPENPERPFRRGQCRPCVSKKERAAKNRMLVRTWPSTPAGRLTCRPWTLEGKPA